MAFVKACSFPLLLSWAETRASKGGTKGFFGGKLGTDRQKERQTVEVLEDVDGWRHERRNVTPSSGGFMPSRSAVSSFVLFAVQYLTIERTHSVSEPEKYLPVTLRYSKAPRASGTRSDAWRTNGMRASRLQTSAHVRQGCCNFGPLTST